MAMPGKGVFSNGSASLSGRVLLFVISRNLLMLTGAWVLTSVGLHHLLTHYSDRPAALLAAHKKFLISRLGDGMMLGALLLTYRQFGTLEFPELFAMLGSMTAESVTGWLTMATVVLFCRRGDGQVGPVSPA